MDSDNNFKTKFTAGKLLCQASFCFCVRFSHHLLSLLCVPTDIHMRWYLNFQPYIWPKTNQPLTRLIGSKRLWLICSIFKPMFVQLYGRNWSHNCVQSLISHLWAQQDQTNLEFITLRIFTWKLSWAATRPYWVSNVQSYKHKDTSGSVFVFSALSTTCGFCVCPRNTHYADISQ